MKVRDSFSLEIKVSDKRILQRMIEFKEKLKVEVGADGKIIVPLSVVVDSLLFLYALTDGENFSNAMKIAKTYKGHPDSHVIHFLQLLHELEASGKLYSTTSEVNLTRLYSDVVRQIKASK